MAFHRDPWDAMAASNQRIEVLKKNNEDSLSQNTGLHNEVDVMEDLFCCWTQAQRNV